MAAPERSRLRKAGIGVTAAGALAIATVGAFEGLRLTAYQDVVGVWTACYGETRGMRAGLRFTPAQCDQMLSDRLVEFESGMRACLSRPDSLPDKTYVAFLSLAYNIGTGAFCRSSVVRKANAGDLKGACAALTAFNKAGGRIVPGLTRRRQQEQALCLAGVR